MSPGRYLSHGNEYRGGEEGDCARDGGVTEIVAEEEVVVVVEMMEEEEIKAEIVEEVEQAEETEEAEDV